MARIRTIKPEFFTSLTIAALPLTARMTFIGLWTHVDDMGRCVDDARLIRAAIWALDDRTLGEVEDDLKALEASKLVVRYSHDDRRYLAVTTWSEHQKISHPTPSKLPPPDATQKPPPTSENALLPNSSGEIPEDSPNAPELLAPERKGKEQGTGNRERALAAAPAAAKKRRTGTRIPDDFAVTTDMVVWAQTNAPNIDGRYETAQFVDYWRAKSGKDATKLDWRLTWQTWMRKAQKDAARTGNVRRGNFAPYRDQAAPSTPKAWRNDLAHVEDPDAA